MNHCDKPNVFEPDEYTTIAIKNIQIDEEIIANYKDLGCEMNFLIKNN